MLNRLKSWKTSGAGLAAGSVAAYLFSSLGCQSPSDWKLWAIGAVSALPGLLGKDK